MRWATSPSTGYRSRVSIRQRGVALAISTAVMMLLILMLLSLAPHLSSGDTSDLVAFGIDAAEEAQAESAKPEEAKAAASPKPADKPPPDPVKPVKTPAAPTPEGPITLPPNVILLSRPDYSAADIAGLKAPPGAAADTGSKASAASGTGSGDSARAQGSGPNGEPLYVAEWYVRPTNAQLSPYRPAALREKGWGIIACRTVANYRVEDCQELEGSPRGMGMAGAVRKAAWQFRVRPPRVGGRELVGEWVVIRIDYTITKE